MYEVMDIMVEFLDMSLFLYKFNYFLFHQNEIFGYDDQIHSFKCQFCFRKFLIDKAVYSWAQIWSSYKAFIFIYY